MTQSICKRVIPLPRRQGDAAASSGLGRAARQGLLALLDQAVVSGANLLTTMMIARFGSKEELGAYSLGFAIVLLSMGLQESLIATPYTIYGCRLLPGARREYRGSVAVQTVLLGIVVVSGLTLAACVLSFSAGSSSLAGVIWALAAVTPFVLLREFARRLALADLRAGVTLLVDMGAVVLQFVLLAALAGVAWLSAATAHGVIGVAGGCAGLAWLASARRCFGPCAHRWRDDMGRGWALGRWLFVGYAASVTQAYGIHWLLALLLGLKAAGLYAACISIVAISNPFMLGVGNILNPKAAWAFAQGGMHGLRQLVWRTTAVLAAAMGMFALAVALVGGEAVRLFYGSEYAGQGMVVAILALGPLIHALGMATGYGLTVIERPHWHLITGVAGAAMTLTVTMLLSPWGLLGAAWGYLAGNIAGTCLRCVAFWIIPHCQDPRPAEADSRLAGTSHEALVPLGTGK